MVAVQDLNWDVPPFGSLAALAFGSVPQKITKLLRIASDSGDGRAGRLSSVEFSRQPDMFLFCSRKMSEIAG